MTGQGRVTTADLPKQLSLGNVSKGLSSHQTPMERGKSLEWAPASATALVRHPELEQWEALEAPPSHPESEGLTLEAEAPGGRRETSTLSHCGSFPNDHPQEAQDFSPAPERAELGRPPAAVSPVPPRSICVPDRSISGSSTCSSLAGSSQESDEVFSDTEQSPASPPERKRVLRKVRHEPRALTPLGLSLGGGRENFLARTRGKHWWGSPSFGGSAFNFVFLHEA